MSDCGADAADSGRIVGLERDALPAQDGSFVDPAKFPWYVGGGLLWAFSDNAFLHPSDNHPGGVANYVTQLRLRRNDGDPCLNDMAIGFIALTGDSEVRLVTSKMPREFSMRGIPGLDEAAVELIENTKGRLGAILTNMRVARTIDAYRLTQTVFNRLAMTMAVEFGVPLRQAGIQITRFGADGKIQEWARVSNVGYAEADATLLPNFSVLISHFYASYAEGLRANSPFYALLCFFTLVEFITNTLQGRFRRYNVERPIAYVDLKGSLSAEDVRFIGHFLAGATYDDVLRETRETRNAVAHFITNVEKVMPRPFNVEAEDRVSFYRDALKVASRALLTKTEQNIVAFKAAGATDEDLRRVIEGTYWTS